MVDNRTRVEGGDWLSRVVGGPTPHIKDGGSVVGTAGTRGRFRDWIFLPVDDLRVPPEFEAAALSPVFCSAGEANQIEGVAGAGVVEN